MKKADIEKRSPNPNGYFGEWRPAINVKWHVWLPEIYKKFRGTKAESPWICRVCGVGCSPSTPAGARATKHEGHKFTPGGIYTVHEFGDDELFWAWVERLDDANEGWEYPNGELMGADEMARESGWERAQELADDVWPERTVKVWSSGRSGGWLYVEGLPDIDEWDAIAVARWAKFKKWIDETVADLDYQFIWHLHVNVYENDPAYNPDAGFQLTLEDA